MLCAVSWLSLAPLVLWAITLLIVPGMVASHVLGARGPLAVALWAPFSIAMIGTSAIALSWLSLAWNPLTTVLSWTVMIALAYALRRAAEAVVGRLPAFAGGAGRWSALAMGLLACAGLTASAITLFARPALFAQTFDNFFHLNAVRYIIDTGNASPWWLSTMVYSQPPSFYPSAWHAFVSLILMSASFAAPNLTIPLTVNAATLALALAAWVPGVMAVTQLVAGPRLGASAVVAGLMGSIYLFPWLYIQWGSLYPNMLGFAAMPGAMVPLLLAAGFPRGQHQPPANALSDHTVRRCDRSASIRTGWYLVLFVGAWVGTALAHPNVAVTLAFVALVVGWGRWLVELNGRRSMTPGLVVSGAPLLVITLALAWAWPRLAPVAAATPVATSVVNEIVGLLLGTTEKAPVTLALPAFILTGVAVALVRRQWVLAIIAVVPAVTIVVVASGAYPALGTILGSVFYNDSHRIAVAALVCAIPAIALAASMIEEFTDRVVTKLAGPHRANHLVPLVCLLLAIAVAIPTWRMATYPQLRIDQRIFVALSPKPRYVGSDEYQLMLRMRAKLPADAKVIGDPGNGSGFIYAIAGVPVVFTHLLVADTAAMSQVRNHLFDEHQLPQTCAALRDLHAYYFADFGPGRFSFSGPEYYPGLSPVQPSMLQLVDQQGAARLYRFTACD